MQPPNHSSGIDKHEFRKLKEDALDLLEWSLHDISPDLHLKMGIENEGHFIPPSLKTLPENFEAHTYRNARTQTLSRLGSGMEAFILNSDSNLPLERIYREVGGSYLLELNTVPLSPKHAAIATQDIRKAMMEYARQQGIQDCDMGFGTINADWLKDWGETANTALHDFKGEVFKTPGNDSLLLAGRGQHANVSLWKGDTNMFAESPHSTGTDALGNRVANESLHMLPGMLLPCRHGNYYRIAHRSTGAITNMACDYCVETNSDCAMNWRERKGGLHKPFTRMEFRQAAPEADPFDVALAAAIPTTKASLEYLVKKDGRHVMPSLMPTSQDAAARLFNTPNNPNFVFLNELAQAKIAKLRERWEKSQSMGDKIVYEQAKVDLRDGTIGTHLHDMYCRQYGLNSEMAAGVTSAPARPGAF